MQNWKRLRITQRNLDQSTPLLKYFTKNPD